MGIGIGSNAIGYPRSLVDSMLTGVSGSLQTQISTLTSQTGSYAAASHIHGNITNGGAIGSISGLVATTTTGGVLTTSSRSGIDSRTSFPNDDVTAATSNATANTIVKRNGSGNSAFVSVQTNSLNATDGIETFSAYIKGESYYDTAATFAYESPAAATHRTALGLGTAATANSSAFATATHAHGNISNSGTIGATADLVVVTSTNGTLTTQTRSGIDSRTSFPNTQVSSATSLSVPTTIVRRDTQGNSTFSGVESTYALITSAQFDYINVALDSQFDSSVTFNATTYNFGAGAASSLKTAIGADSFEDQNILAISLFA
jgi:hypothetical protein